MSWSAIYIMASLVTVGWAILADRQRLRDVACMLFWFCVLSNSARVLWGQHTAAALYPIMDIIGLTITSAIYARHRREWARVLAFLFLAQIAAHVAYLGHEVANGYYYALTLNVLFSLQLFTVMVAGAPHVWHRICNIGVVPHHGGGHNSEATRQ